MKTVPPNANILGELAVDPHTGQLVICTRDERTGESEWLEVRHHEDRVYVKNNLKTSGPLRYFPVNLHNKWLIEKLRKDRDERHLFIDEVIYELDCLDDPDKKIAAPAIPAGVFVLAKGLSDFQLAHALAGTSPPVIDHPPFPEPRIVWK